MPMQCPLHNLIFTKGNSLIKYLLNFELNLNIINNNLWEWQMSSSSLYIENNIHRKQELTNMPHTILFLEIFWIIPIFLNKKRNFNIDFEIGKMIVLK